MKTRRGFVKLLAVAGVAGATQRVAAEVAPANPAPRADASPAGERARWCAIARQLATPVLNALAQRRLRELMPVEAKRPGERTAFAHLEALGRLLCGLAPWLEAPDDNTGEGTVRAQLAALARQAIDSACDPASPDFMNFNRGRQPLVDAAFLAQAILRAPNALWSRLESRTRANLVAALKSSRVISPPENNWLLFASMIEAALRRCGETPDSVRLLGGLQKFQHWYVGDGWYGDGPEFHWDYYNAFVIQPMLNEVLEVVATDDPSWRSFRETARGRLTRFAAIEERLIAPDGTYPPIGRSLAYRCGAFQGLAFAARHRLLPPEVKPGQARGALTAVIRRTLEAPDTFDAQGWLRIGLSGHQPSLGETYISTGSLYLCSAAFLPLGLPPGDPFWTERASPTTWQKAWRGTDLPADHALPPPRSG
jgi:hypothetical protein